MRKQHILFLILIMICPVLHITAQVNILSNTHVTSSGNVQVVISELDLVNNGTLNHGSGIVKFTGSSTGISGKGTTTFYQLYVSKNAATGLSLEKNISVASGIYFNTGLLNLNGNNITLLPGALLVNEQELSRITGLNGGYVSATANLNAPPGIDVGNLGAVITSSQNMGSVTFRRGHKPQTNVANGNSIQRYFDIIPANNTSLDATLRFKYFDAELNGNTEASLHLFQSNDNINWVSRSYSSRDGAANFVEKTGLNDFSRMTLRTSNIIACDLVFYRDADGDGFGDANNPISGCEVPGGYVANSNDCDDGNAAVYPGATELCNGRDDDCDGLIDEQCPAGPVTISINDIVVNEMQGTAQLTVSLSAPSTGTVSVKYKTENGTARHPKDYTNSAGTLVFAPGVTAMVINVPIIQDNIAEANEYFNVNLNTPVGATISDNSGRVTITEMLITDSRNVNEEAESKFQFEVKVSSNPTHSQFRLDISSDTEKSVTIQVSDAWGRIMETIRIDRPFRPVFLGNHYRTGLYFVEVKQGDHRKSLKLVKL